MKVGDIFPARQTRGKPCPECGDKVFKSYPSGFVIESARVVEETKSGFKIRNEWHCPACGHWKPVITEVNRQGFKVPPKETISFTHKPNSSDKSKRRRKYQ